ncbi:hypothetical protein LBMAG38_02880 [Chloroflexota bacterium]|nr:hypothetical protein LBMAG38_02880 [Chloroflexota bacterium]
MIVTGFATTGGFSAAAAGTVVGAIAAVVAVGADSPADTVGFVNGAVASCPHDASSEVPTTPRLAAKRFRLETPEPHLSLLRSMVMLPSGTWVMAVTARGWWSGDT